MTLEIGFGMGTSLVTMASAPGAELPRYRYTRRVGACLATARRGR
ncbi:MAG: hypothetical protein ACLTXH_12430 [Enterobacter hormaechei]